MKLGRKVEEEPLTCSPTIDKRLAGANPLMEETTTSMKG